LIRKNERPRGSQPEAVDANSVQLQLITLPADSQGLRLANLVGVDDICVAWRCSRRYLERLRKSGAFPAPDRMIGRSPKWRIEAINALLVRQNGEVQG
jgi:hypothetical protein